MENKQEPIIEVYSNPEEKDPQYSSKYTFVLGPTGEPIKLGDGSFGAVFLGESKSTPEQYCAIKLLYEIYEAEKDSSGTPAEEQFKHEMKIGETLRKSSSGKTAHVVNIIGGTDDFKAQQAYTALKSSFERLNISVSKYAEAMDLYAYSLKDLLERGPMEGGPKVRKQKANYCIAQNAFEEVSKGQRQITEKKMTSLKDFAASSPDVVKAEIEQILVGEEYKEVRKTLGEGVINRIGYELLKVMSFEERLRTIWPILFDVAQGLETIHQIKEPNEIAHLDVKPANVYIDTSGDILHVALGDFGFTNVDYRVGYQAPNIEDALPLGTLHYRSPEQKDYRDVCYANVVSVQPQKASSQNSERGEQSSEASQVKLEISDPKFHTSFIEPNDFVIFSKDSTRTRYPIMEVRRGDVNRPTEVVLNTTTTKVFEDTYTQVWLYKKQGDRTDIWGIGALAYDMLTCGQSPERFYENIRRFEKNDDGTQSKVSDVIEKYVQVSEFQSTEPGLQPIFEPLRDPRTGKYAPKWFVEWILKCMLYSAEETYYAESLKRDMRNGTNVFTLIKNDLESFIREALRSSINREAVSSSIKTLPSELPVIDRPHWTSNPLITLDVPRAGGRGTLRLADVLDGILKEPNKHEKRLAQGIYYFNALVTLLGKKFIDRQDAAKNSPYAAVS